AGQGDQGLGDGVLLSVEDQAGQPLLEALEAGVGESVGKGFEESLPKGEQLGSLHEAPPVFKGVRGVVTTDILRTGGASGYPPLLASHDFSGHAKGHIFRKLLLSGNIYNLTNTFSNPSQSITLRNDTSTLTLNH